MYKHTPIHVTERFSLGGGHVDVINHVQQQFRLPIVKLTTRSVAYTE